MFERCPHGEAVEPCAGEPAVFDAEDIGTGAQIFKQRGVGSGEPGLRAEGDDFLEQRRSSTLIEMRRDFVEQEDGRLAAARAREFPRIREHDGDEERLSARRSSSRVRPCASRRVPRGKVAGVRTYARAPRFSVTDARARQRISHRLDRIFALPPAISRSLSPVIASWAHGKAPSRSPRLTSASFRRATVARARRGDFDCRSPPFPSPARRATQDRAGQDATAARVRAWPARSGGCGARGRDRSRARDDRESAVRPLALSLNSRPSRASATAMRMISARSAELCAGAPFRCTWRLVAALRTGDEAGADVVALARRARASRATAHSTSACAGCGALRVCSAQRRAREGHGPAREARSLRADWSCPRRSARRARPACRSIPRPRAHRNGNSSA